MTITIRCPDLPPFSDTRDMPRYLRENFLTMNAEDIEKISLFGTEEVALLHKPTQEWVKIPIIKLVRPIDQWFLFFALEVKVNNRIKKMGEIF